MCPVCQMPMATLEFELTNVEHCVRCEGTWIDSGELELMGAAERRSLDRVSPTVADAEDAGRTRRRCPRCHRHLRKITLVSDDGLIVDRCPSGHGLWFDHGEMLALIHAFGGDQFGPAARYFSNLYGVGPSERGDA